MNNLENDNTTIQTIIKKTKILNNGEIENTSETFDIKNNQDLLSAFETLSSNNDLDEFEKNQIGSILIGSSKPKVSSKKTRNIQNENNTFVPGGSEETRIKRKKRRRKLQRNRVPLRNMNMNFPIGS